MDQSPVAESLVHRASTPQHQSTNSSVKSQYEVTQKLLTMKLQYSPANPNTDEKIGEYFNIKQCKP
ncbi:UNVERIFIED_CONTAM: hypothetical protein NCL1_25281 [Trichonephila clavipes]